MSPHKNKKPNAQQQDDRIHTTPPLWYDGGAHDETRLVTAPPQSTLALANVQPPNKSSLFNEGKDAVERPDSWHARAAYDIDATAYDIDHVNDAMDC